MSGIKLAKVKIKNFRCLKSSLVHLRKTNILIGENNAGKTTFLEALAYVFHYRRGANGEDIYIGPTESTPPRDREALIDILLQPVDENGNRIANFSGESYWLQLFGTGIFQDEEDNFNEGVAIRTRIYWETERGEYAIERKFLKSWSDDDIEIEINEKAGQFSIGKAEPFIFELLEAKRDLVDDIKNKHSFWGKLTTDLNLSPEISREINNTLLSLNDTINESSDVLTHIKENMDTFSDLTGVKPEHIKIVPIPRTASEINKSVDIVLKNHNSAPFFPISKHGMGTRSLSSIVAFEAFTKWKNKQAKKHVIHPIIAIEEPETHLHPHLQRALASKLTKFPGQTFISSHSPYLASSCDLRELILFVKSGSSSNVVSLGDSFSDEDIQSIERWIQGGKSDLLYAKSVVLFEGESEEKALPLLATKHFNKDPHSLGISFVPVGGAGNYRPFVKLCQSFSIPFFIFSDNDQNVKTEIETILREETNITTQAIFLPDGNDFETYMVSQHRTETIETLLEFAKKVNSDHRYLDSKKQEYQRKSDSDLIELAKKDKISFARKLTEILINKSIIPEKVTELFEKIKI